MRVLVAGGGIAGLYAAARLARQGHAVRLVEQADYLGGRLFTVHHPDGAWQYEAGGARFHDGHARLTALLRKLRLHAAPLPGDFMHVPPGAGEAARPVDIGRARARACAPDLGPRGRAVGIAEALAGRPGGPADVEALRQEVGYDAEFQLSHAEDCLRSLCGDLAADRTFYVVKEGFSEVIRRLADYARRHGAKIDTGVTLLGYRADPGGGPCRARLRPRPDPAARTEELETDAIVLALPLAAALRLDGGPPSDAKAAWARQLRGAPLMRLYAAWPEEPDGGDPWWARKGLRKTTVDRRRPGCQHLQFFIPLGHPRLAMASYSDGDTADWWRALEQQDPSGGALRDALTRELRAAFGADVPPPEAVMPHYWPAGVHMMAPRPGEEQVRDAELVRRWAQPDPRVPVVLANEAFALHHQWVEGSLESACRALRRLRALPLALAGGGAPAAAATRVELRPSTQAGKKWRATIHRPGGRRRRTVHFGAAGMSDYTKHKDPARKKRYIARHRKREDWKRSGLATPGFWSRWLLWNLPSLRASRADMARRFRLTFV